MDSQVRRLIQDALRERPAPVLSEVKKPDLVVKQDAPPQNKSHELALADQQVANMKADRELRGSHAKYAYRLALGCLIMWWTVVFAQGVGNAFFGVKVWDSTVMIAITTGVTVNVLAAFLGVIRGLFGKKVGNG